MSRLAPVLFSIISAFGADVTPQQLIENGHYNRARAILEPRLQSAPQDAEALRLMSQIKLLSGDDEGSLRLAEQALKLNPADRANHLQMVKVLVSLTDHAGGVRQISLGRQLKSELQSVLAADPGNVEALKVQESIYRNAPALFGGDKKKAQQMADKILQIDPVQGGFLQAEIATAGKQNARVEEIYRKAVQANPNSYEAHIRLSYFCLLGLKNYADSEAHARAAIALNPDRIDAYGLLVSGLALQAKWPEVDAVVSQAQSAIPDDLSPYYKAASQMVRKGVELPRAEHYLEMYLSRDPELNQPTRAMALLQMGQLREKQGRPADAITEYEAALKLDPGSSARRDLDRLKSQPSPNAPPYTESHFNDLIRNIAAGTDSVERGQAITLQLTRMGIGYESRPFDAGGHTGANIIASLPAPAPGAPVLMLGAHLDRVAAGKGAVDNGSGVATVLELLVQLKRHPVPNYHIVAAFWDAEEEGLLGSSAYLASQSHDSFPAIYLNFDMVGYGDTLLANWKDEKSKGALAFHKAADNQFPMRTDFEFPPSDDRPFTDAGIEVVAVALGDSQDIETGLKLIRGENVTSEPRILKIMHTAEDTPDKVRAADVCRVLPVIERAVRSIAESR